MSVKKSDIQIEVVLDDNQNPSLIKWEAMDGATPIKQESKGMFLAFFDKESKETFKIDLWTTDMQVGEMDRFMFHTLKSLSETYYKATQNTELSNHMKSFVQHFGEFTKIIPK